MSRRSIYVLLSALHIRTLAGCDVKRRVSETPDGSMRVPKDTSSLNIPSIIFT